MDPQFEELAQRLKDELAQHLESRLTTAVVEHLAAAEGRLIGQYKIHAEEMKAEVNLAAEGYGATLESLDRRLDRLEKNWTARFGDHESLLKIHEKRISSLEESR
jgi:hypothetical protein